MKFTDSQNISRVIGEGAYGCVLKPSLKCSNLSKSVNYKNKISKIMDKSEALIELNEYERIAKVDKNADFYTGKPEICIPAMSNENIKAIKKCKYRDIDELKKYYLLIMEDGGKNLTIFADSIYDYLSRGNINIDSKEYHELQEIMYKFWEECIRLFLGLHIFLKNGLVHHDIKPQNILYDIDRNRLNYIDFGLMTTIKEIKETSFSSHNHNAMIHWSFPPEMPYTNKLEYTKLAKMNRKNKIKTFDRFIKDMADSESKINYFFKNTVLDYYKKHESETIIQHMKEYYDLLFKVIVPNKYNKFLESVIDTIDSYGLGVSLLYVLNKTYTLIDPIYAVELRKIFSNMVNFNVMKRKSIETLIEEYKTIIKLRKSPNSFQSSENGKTKEFIEEKLESIKIENANISNKKLDKDPTPVCPKLYEYDENLKRCVKTLSMKSISKSKSRTRKRIH